MSLMLFLSFFDFLSLTVPVIVAIISAGVSLWSMFSSLHSRKELQNEKHSFIENFENYKNQLKIEYLRNEIKTTHKLEIYPTLYGEFFKIFKNASIIINASYRDQISLESPDEKIREILLKNNNTEEEIWSFLKMSKEIKIDPQTVFLRGIQKIYRCGIARMVNKQISNTEDYFYLKSLFISETCKTLCLELFNGLNRLMKEIEISIRIKDEGLDDTQLYLKIEKKIFDKINLLEVKMKTEIEF